jgi:hypothetical protein
MGQGTKLSEPNSQLTNTRPRMQRLRAGTPDTQQRSGEAQRSDTAGMGWQANPPKGVTSTQRRSGEA